MVFLQGQALDNRSADPFVVDGLVLEGNDPRVQAALRESSAVQLEGVTSTTGDTIVTRLGDLVAIQISTNQVDIGGRPSPILAMLAWPELEGADLSELVRRVAADASRIDRTFDVERLTRDIESWRASPKARGGPLTRLYRRFRSWFRRHWGRSEGG